jgi:hypothetical protein
METIASTWPVEARDKLVWMVSMALLYMSSTLICAPFGYA